MMMNIKPKIFVSSTVSDLTNEREAARLAIEEIGGEYSMCEHSFIAENKNSLDVCLNNVRKSDIYILILGGRYGFECEDGYSITEKEWYTASEESIAILVFNLKYFIKEDKQQKFANKIGDIYKGRFWKEIDNVFQLKEEIKKSLRHYLDDYKIERYKDTEPLYASLIEITFPQHLYIGDLSIERNNIIQNSKLGQHPLSKKANTREVVREALIQNNQRFALDWITYNNKIVTFHDISRADCPLSKIIDLGTAEQFTCAEFYEANEDQNRVFKNLLRFCLQNKLYKMGVKWIPEYKHFRFVLQEGCSKSRTARWRNIKDATRTVVDVKMNEKNSIEYYTYKHFAFKTSFFDIDSKWYLNIQPDWAFTYDGIHPHKFEDEKITYLKKNERNLHVFNHTKFVYDFLKYKDVDDLFSMRYPFIDFKDIVNLNAFPKLYDGEWIDNENDKGTFIDNSGEIPFNFN